MVHACVTMLSHCLETQGKGDLIKLGHAHAAREHGTRPSDGSGLCCGLIRAKGPAVFLAQPEGLGCGM